MTAFWNSLKRHHKCKFKSSLTTDHFAAYYADIMHDQGDLSVEQQKVSDKVNSVFAENIDKPFKEEITPDTIICMINKLNRSCSPGIDGISAEHLYYGNSQSLCKCLSQIYSTILTYHVVPESFTQGVIVPIPKKAGSDPNNTCNYRPITLCSTYAKLMEIYMTPQNNICENQFGFQEGKSTAMACSLLNDVIMYSNYRGSQLHICSLDAEKCFDKIWHAGLLYKLLDVLPLNKWIFIAQWYRNIKACIRWQGHYSKSFRVTRGTRQGSTLSPLFFNVFIDDLLKEIKHHKHGINIGPNHYNSMAYADDITLFSLTTSGLQSLIDICEKYAKEWRFNFGVKKSKCMSVGPNYLTCTPTWFLGDNRLENMDSLEILGVIFDKKCNGMSHVKTRSTKCRRTFYSMAPMGMNYPGLTSEAKAYIWKSACLPALTYGIEAIHTSESATKQLDSLQGCLMKQCLGISKTSHHTHLCQALGLPPVREIVKQQVLTLWYNTFNIESPTRDLCLYLLSMYIASGQIIPGTLLDRVQKTGVSPTRAVFNQHTYTTRIEPSGLTDTLYYLVTHRNYRQSTSEEYMMVKLLTRTF
jgi:hypothetical protein